LDRRNVIRSFRESLKTAGFEGIKAPYIFTDIQDGQSVTQEVALAAFTGGPQSYRNAQVGVVFSGETNPSEEFAERYRALGAPLLFEVSGTGIQGWGLGQEAPRQLGKVFAPERVQQEFRRNRKIWKPEVLGRVKKASDISGDSQLALFNLGLLPTLEHFFNIELRSLLETAFRSTRESFRSIHGTEPEVRSLFPYLFRFLTAKIFMDRADARGWKNLDSARVVFQQAEDHSGSGLLAKLPSEFLDERVLDAAWEAISGNLNFQNLWVPDLAEIYESAFITKETRKELGVHSTPHGLAEYVVQHLPWEDLPKENRRVFEPFCGHGMLLASAMQRLGEDLDPALPPAKRHAYFRRRLTGVEKDPFAIEVCRLVLTLTDYPNHNRWDLYPDDVFSWEGWDTALAKSDVVLANPPYEKFKDEERSAIGASKPYPPAEMLRRLMTRPPAMLGLILPQSFLSGPSYREANRDLARNYAEVQVVELPKMFRYADNETIALLASGRRESGNCVSVHYADVPGESLDAFLNDWKVCGARSMELPVPKNREPFTFRLPPADSVFRDNCGTVLGDVAEIHKGLHWNRRTDGRRRSEPREDVASNRPKKGYLKGAEKMKGNLTQFQIRKLRYLSTKSTDHYERDSANQLDWTESKVAVNAARFERHSPWRIAAFADSEGLAFTKQFFAIWLDKPISINAVAAVLNSPFGNGFSFEEDLEKHNHIATLKNLVLPPAEFLNSGGAIDRLAQRLQTSFAEDTSLLDMKKPDWREARREALIRLDAAVLDAYALDAAEQRRLLNLFDGHRRPVADIDFTSYFPEHFNDDITLSDFVKINYDWEETNDRRSDLIEKKFHGGGLTCAESKELNHLQHLTDLMVNLKDPGPISRADEIIAQLKAEGKWKEPT